MWELDYKGSLALKNWWFWTVVLEKTLEGPLDFKEIQPVHPKGGQTWVFIGKTDIEAETPILWPPDAKSWLIWKDHDAGKDSKREESGMAESEMVGWHHWTPWTWVWVNSGSWWWTERLDVHGVTKSQTRLPELNWISFYVHISLFVYVYSVRLNLWPHQVPPVRFIINIICKWNYSTYRVYLRLFRKWPHGVLERILFLKIHLFLIGG